MFGAAAFLAATQFWVTVLDPGTGLLLPGLGADDFVAAGRVESVRVANKPVAALLLVDTSVAGEVVRGTVEKLIGELGGKDRMALMTFNQNVSMAQGFTAGAAPLLGALARVRYEGDPRTHDGLAAALQCRFPDGDFRRVIALVTAGIEGPSRIQESAVIQLAREKGIAIYPIYLHGSGRWAYADMARNTGGAPFWLRETGSVAGIWETIRQPYLLTLQGPAGPIKTKSRVKTFVSSLLLVEE